MKKLVIIPFLFLALGAFSQDTVWKKVVIDENMTIQLPTNTTKIDTVLDKGNGKLRFLIYKATTKNSSLGVSVTPNEVNLKVDNPESLRNAYKEIESGFRENAASKGFSSVFSDTSIDNIAGKKAVATLDNAENNMAFTSYLFLLNDKLYSIIFTPVNNANNEAKKDIDQLLNSVHFNQSNVQEQKFSSKAQSIGYKIGYYIIPALLIIAIVSFIARKRRK